MKNLDRDVISFLQYRGADHWSTLKVAYLAYHEHTWCDEVCFFKHHKFRPFWGDGAVIVQSLLSRLGFCTARRELDSLPRFVSREPRDPQHTPRFTALACCGTPTAVTYVVLGSEIRAVKVVVNGTSFGAFISTV